MDSQPMTTARFQLRFHPQNRMTQSSPQLCEALQPRRYALVPWHFFCGYGSHVERVQDIKFFGQGHGFWHLKIV